MRREYVKSFSFNKEKEKQNKTRYIYCNMYYNICFDMQIDNNCRLYTSISIYCIKINLYIIMPSFYIGLGCFNSQKTGFLF